MTKRSNLVFRGYVLFHYFVSDNNSGKLGRPYPPACSPTPWWVLGAVLLLSGCSAAHYRRSADKQSYGIIQEVEQGVFGRTNAFSIDTPYSKRKVEEIKPSELIEDRAAKGQRMVSIEEALDLAVNRSRSYQSAREALYSSALTLTGQRHVFGPQFFGSVTPTYSRIPDRGQDSLAVRDGVPNGPEVQPRDLNSRKLIVGTSIGVSQLLTSGGELGINLANDILRYYTGNARQSVVSIVSVNLAQPLLRGFGRNNPDVERLTQAERNVVYAVRKFAFFQDQFALDVVNDYFDLLAQKDVIRNRYTNYLGRVQSTKRLEARAKDRERLSDVDQARQAELTAKNNYVNEVASYRNSLDKFKITLGLPLGEKISFEDTVLDEMEKNGLVPAPLDPEQAYRVAVQRQLQILNAIDAYEDIQRKVRVSANQLKPGLNVFAKASLDSDRPTDYTHFDPANLNRSVGVELDLPLDRLNERNTYRATLISFEEELRKFTLTLDNLKDSIDRGLRTLGQRRQNYEIQRNALTLANRRVASTTLLLEAGRAEVRDLVDAQDAQIAAQNAVTLALVDYQQTRLQLLLDVGALDTSTPRFWLKDHLAGFVPAGQPMPAPTESVEQPVLPPDQYFQN